MTPDADGKQAWQMSAPSDGVQPPWPQLIEIVQAIPHTRDGGPAEISCHGDVAQPGARPHVRRSWDSGGAEPEMV